MNATSACAALSSLVSRIAPAVAGEFQGAAGQFQDMVRGLVGGQLRGLLRRLGGRVGPRGGGGLVLRVDGAGQGGEKQGGERENSGGADHGRA